MLKKTHALALAAATVGLIGFTAPLASAATMHGHGGGSQGGLVNLSGNQVPVQVCGNDVDGNVAGGQVPAEGDAVVGSLLSPGSVTKSKATDNRGCQMVNNQSGNGKSKGGLLNAAGNQIPLQGCGNQVMANGLGGQVPLTGLSGALALLSPASITSSHALQNQGCAAANSQHS
jgi:hypothetical protein